MSGSLAKLVIHSFKKNDFKEEATDSLFTAPINPESFTKNFKVNLDDSSAHGSPGKAPKFKSVGTQELKLEFILDGTGTMEGYVEAKKPGKNDVYLSVSDQLKAFLKCVNDYDGDIHRPRFLIIIWGSEIRFPCVLSNLDVHHTLFDPQGFPVRIKITATFLNYASPQAQLAAAKINSPDMTHYRKTREGDRLDLMTYRIYNDSKYFMQVARSNGLTTLRKLTPGSDIYFPPFNKNED
jgi:hypothetical protein